MCMLITENVQRTTAVCTNNMVVIDDVSMICIDNYIFFETAIL